MPVGAYPFFISALPQQGSEVGAFYTTPCAMMALATFMKPATLAPFT